MISGDFSDARHGFNPPAKTAMQKNIIHMYFLMLSSFKNYRFRFTAAKQAVNRNPRLPGGLEKRKFYAGLSNRNGCGSEKKTAR
jgi:hypothetical protein